MGLFVCRELFTAQGNSDSVNSNKQYNQKEGGDMYTPIEIIIGIFFVLAGIIWTTSLVRRRSHIMWFVSKELCRGPLVLNEIELLNRVRRHGISISARSFARILSEMVTGESLSYETVPCVVGKDNCMVREFRILKTVIVGAQLHDESAIKT